MTPLTPHDCDLRGFEYMPLYGNHLFGSDFNARVSDAGWRAAVTLWWAAWNQVPAASLPADDLALTRLADLGRDVKSFRKIRAEALSGFVECDDGRLYHKALSEWAIAAWQRRTEFAEGADNKLSRQQRWRNRQKELSEQLRAIGVTPPAGASLVTLETLLETSTETHKRLHGDAGETSTASAEASTERLQSVYSETPTPSPKASTVDVSSVSKTSTRRCLVREVKGSKVKNNGVEVTTVPSVDGPNADPLTPIFETKQGEKQGKTFDLPQQMLKMPPGWRTDDRATDQAGRLLGLTPGTFESYSEFRRRISEKFEAYRLEFLGIRPTISDAENGAGKYAE